MDDHDREVAEFFETADEATLAAAPKLSTEEVKDLLDKNRSDLRRAFAAPRPGRVDPKIRFR